MPNIADNIEHELDKFARSQRRAHYFLLMPLNCVCIGLNGSLAARGLWLGEWTAFLQIAVAVFMWHNLRQQQGNYARFLDWLARERRRVAWLRKLVEGEEYRREHSGEGKIKMAEEFDLKNVTSVEVPVLCKAHASKFQAANKAKPWAIMRIAQVFMDRLIERGQPKSAAEFEKLVKEAAATGTPMCCSIGEDAVDKILLEEPGNGEA